MLPVVAAASIVVALIRRARLPRPASRRRTGHDNASRRNGAIRTAAQITIVCLAVVGPITYTLNAHHSVGPVAYKITDLDGWVMQTDGMMYQSVSSAIAGEERSNPDLVQQFWDQDAHNYSWPFEASPLAANLDWLLGMGATETQDAFLVVYLLTAALGAFVAVRYAVRRPTWAAVLAGSLFGGTQFLQVFFDGAEPVVSALALLLALAVIGSEALVDPRPANTGLVVLLVAGMASALPPFLAPLALATLGIVCFRTVRRFRSPAEPGRRSISTRFGHVTALVVLPFAINPVGVYRAVDTLVHIRTLIGHLPNYDLNLITTPGWLSQTVSLYSLGLSGRPVVGTFVLYAVVPILVALGVVAALRCRPFADVMLPLLLASAVVAIGGYYSDHNSGPACSYCLDRGLDPVAASVPALLGIGIALLAASQKRAFRLSALALIIAVVPSVGYATYREWHGFDTGSYFLDTTVRKVIRYLPATGCTVLEGFNDAVPSPPAEAVLVYALAEEHAPGRIGMLTDMDDNGALKYFNLKNLPPHGSTAVPTTYFLYRLHGRPHAGGNHQRRADHGDPRRRRGPPATCHSPERPS